VLVIFNRTGGLAYSDQTLTIHIDGTATFEIRSGPQHFKVDGEVRADRLEALTALLNDPAFATLPSQPYVPGAARIATSTRSRR
jgi:hypothetical protein